MRFRTFKDNDGNHEIMELHIKNMVCDRCKMVVKSLLEERGVHPEKVGLGIVQIKGNLDDAQLADIEQGLSIIGFELLDDQNRKLIEKIKTAVIELIHYEAEDNRIKHSEYLVQHTGKDYPSISKLFSEEEGITIEQYIIQQKIELVKELLTYGELTLSEIAWQMGYSSVAAISAQFKKVTGQTPTAWKVEADTERTALDRVGKN